MANIQLNINGRSYDMACDDGQEGRVRELASYINQKATMLAQAGGGKNENHILMLTSLVLADEVFDLRARNGAVQSGIGLDPNDLDKARALIDNLIKRVEVLSQHIEKQVA